MENGLSRINRLNSVKQCKQCKQCKFGANSISDGIMIIIPKVEIKKVLAAARHSREDKKMSSRGGHNDLTNKLFE